MFPEPLKRYKEVTGIVLNVDRQQPYTGLAELPVAAFSTAEIDVIYRFPARATDDAWMGYTWRGLLRPP